MAKHLDPDPTTYGFAIPIGLIGLIANGISFCIIRKSPRYRNVSGILFTAYVLFHAQTVSVLLFFTFIRIIVNIASSSFPWKIFASIAFPLVNSTVFAAIWTHLILALNHLTAISFPVLYHRIFNKRNAWITVISLWLCAILITGHYYNVECVRYKEAIVHSWSLLYGPCKQPFFAYIAMILSDGIILIAVTVDGIAFYRIIVYLKKKRIDGTQQRARKEILFFKETCVTTIIHTIFGIIYRFNLPMSRLSKVTYTWLAIITIDGFAFIYFNRHSLKQQNAVSFHTNIMGLRTKAIRNHVNTVTIRTEANNRIQSRKKKSDQ